MASKVILLLGHMYLFYQGVYALQISQIFTIIKDPPHTL